MRKSFRQLMQGVMQGTFLSLLAVSNSHADFLGTLNQTINKVQQTVGSTKQAVDSTTQTVNGAQQAVEATTNTVQQIPQQAQQLPVQVNQIPAQPVQQPYLQPQSQSTAPQNGAVIDQQVLNARRMAYKEQHDRVFGATAEMSQKMQISERINEFSRQWWSEKGQIESRYMPQIQQDPNNQLLQSQYQVELAAAEVRFDDRAIQYLRTVQVVPSSNGRSTLVAP